MLPPEIFDCLERTAPGRGGEIQLTDGMRLLVKERGLHALIYEGKSYDAGDKLGFLKATVEIGTAESANSARISAITYADSKALSRTLYLVPRLGYFFP